MQPDRILAVALAHCVTGGLGWEVTRMIEPLGPHKGEGEGPPRKGAVRRMTAYPLQRLPCHFLGAYEGPTDIVI